MEKKKVVITGLGAITPLGIGVKEYWQNLIAGKSGISINLSPRCYFMGHRRSG